MNANSHPPPVRPRRLSFRALGVAGLVLLAAHGAWFTLHTDRAARALDATLVPPTTIPGMAEPRFFLDNDAYAWMAHTRDLMASGGWRLRHTFMDNAPYGREMHWSHLLIWSLRGLASAIMAVTDWPAARAVELAGVWIMPLFQFLALAAFFLVLAKKTGWVPAALFCALFLTLNGFVWAFHPLRPDHHGFQLCFVLGSFLCLQLGGLGWTRRGTAPEPGGVPAFRAPPVPDPAEARRWFVAAGVLGGLALWVGATIWMFALAVVVAAATTALPRLGARADVEETYLPNLWRWWAGAGCATGLAFYLLEYAPAHFAMRLEVNHPWHWIFWLGAAEVLRTAGTLAPAGSWLPERKTDRMLGAVGLLAAASLPLAILLGPPEWHQMRAAVLQRLHARFIEEFKGFRAAIEGSAVLFFLLRFGLLPLVFPWVGGLVWQERRVSSPARRAMLFGLVFAGLFLALSVWQQRWGFFLAGGMAGLFVLAFAHEMTQPPGRRLRRLLGASLAAALLANAVVADGMRLRSETLTADADSVIPAWVQSCVMKRMALQFGFAAGAEEWRMVGLATEAPMLYYFAGIRTVASYYWENAAGWQAESAFFADTPDGAAARALARERGLTHVCISQSPELPKLYWFVATGRYSVLEGMQRTLAGQLAVPGGGDLPDWIRRDARLSELGETTYVFRTPRGLAPQKTWAQVYRLEAETGE